MPGARRGPRSGRSRRPRGALRVPMGVRPPGGRPAGSPGGAPPAFSGCPEYSPAELRALGPLPGRRPVLRRRCSADTAQAARPGAAPVARAPGRKAPTHRSAPGRGRGRESSAGAACDGIGAACGPVGAGWTRRGSGYGTSGGRAPAHGHGSGPGGRSGWPSAVGPRPRALPAPVPPASPGPGERAPHRARGVVGRRCACASVHGAVRSGRRRVRDAAYVGPGPGSPSRFRGSRWPRRTGTAPGPGRGRAAMCPRPGARRSPRDGHPYPLRRRPQGPAAFAEDWCRGPGSRAHQAVPWSSGAPESRRCPRARVNDSDETRMPWPRPCGAPY